MILTIARDPLDRVSSPRAVHALKIFPRNSRHILSSYLRVSAPPRFKNFTPSATTLQDYLPTDSNSYPHFNDVMLPYKSNSLKNPKKHLLFPHPLNTLQTNFCLINTRNPDNTFTPSGQSLCFKKLLNDVRFATFDLSFCAWKLSLILP